MLRPFSVLLAISVLYCADAGLGSACANDADCTFMFRSCILTKCSCRTGFMPDPFFSMKICSRVLGSHCSRSSDKLICEEVVNHSICGKDTCECKKWYESKDDLTCTKVSCNLNRCGQHGDVNATCVSDFCSCSKGYTYDKDEDTCRTVLGSSCKLVDQCENQVNNSTCVGDICKCSKDFIPNEDNVSCRPGLRSICSLIKQIGKCEELVGNATCYEDDTCRCKTNFKSQDSLHCIHVVDSDCTTDSDCLVSNLTNINCLKIDNTTSKCKCSFGFSDYDDQCYKVPNNTCPGPGQGECSDYMNNTKCFDSGHFSSCQCKKGYFEENGTCIAVLNSPCKNDSDCLHGETVHGEMGVNCQKEHCKCKPGYWNIEAECSKVHPSPYVPNAKVVEPESVTEENMGNRARQNVNRIKLEAEDDSCDQRSDVIVKKQPGEILAKAEASKHDGQDDKDSEPSSRPIKEESQNAPSERPGTEFPKRNGKSTTEQLPESAILNPKPEQNIGRYYIRGTHVGCYQTTGVSLTNVNDYRNYVKRAISDKLVRTDDIAQRFCEIVKRGTRLILCEIANRYLPNQHNLNCFESSEEYFERHWSTVRKSIKFNTGCIIMDPRENEYPLVGLSRNLLHRELVKLNLNPDCMNKNAVQAFNQLLWHFCCFYRDWCFCMASEKGRDCVELDDVERALNPEKWKQIQKKEVLRQKECHSTPKAELRKRHPKKEFCKRNLFPPLDTHVYM